MDFFNYPFPNSEIEEVISSHVLLAGDKARVDIEAAEDVRVVVLRLKSDSKTSIHFSKIKKEV